MKLKYEFVINTVADKMIAVPVGGSLDDFNGLIKMNDVGVDIFNTLKNDVTEDEIVGIMKEKYADTPEDEIRETVKEFVGKLMSEGIVE